MDGGKGREGGIGLEWSGRKEREGLRYGGREGGRVVLDYSICREGEELKGIEKRSCVSRLDWLGW